MLSSTGGNDFTINDFYNKVADSRNVSVLDRDVVIIDIANADRDMIADVMETVALCGPRAVGMDILFAEPKENDSRLITALDQCPNLVMAVSVLPDSTGSNFTVDDKTYFTDSLRFATIAAINFPTQQTNRTVREFRPDYPTADGKGIPSFALALSETNSSSPNPAIFRSRGNEHEMIRYYSRSFRIYTPDEVADHAEELAGRIVLIGAVNDLADLHATPVDAAMSGILIHAHSIATILSGSYFYQLHKYANWAIAFICYMLVNIISLSINISVKGLLLRVLQVVLLYLSIRIGYWLFIDHNIVVNFSYLLLMLTFGLFACDIWIGVTAIIKWVAGKLSRADRSTINNIATQ